MLVAEVLFGEGQHSVEIAGAEAALRSIECSALEREQRAVRVALAEAERKNDEDAIMRLVVRNQTLARELRALQG